jgi:hypothetical protein
MFVSSKFFDYYSKIMLFGTLLNLYKLFLFINVIITSEPYKIRSWSTPIFLGLDTFRIVKESDTYVVSKSHPVWLIIHLLLSVYHVWVTFSLIRKINTKNTNVNIEVLNFSHIAFVFVVMINSFNYEKLSTQFAFVLNTIVCLSLVITMKQFNTIRDQVILKRYYALLTLPVLIQFIRVVLNIKIIFDKIMEFFWLFILIILLIFF